MTSKVPILYPYHPNFPSWVFYLEFGLPFRALVIIVSFAGHHFPNPCPDVVVEIYIYSKMNGILEF